MIRSFALIAVVLSLAGCNWSIPFPVPSPTPTAIMCQGPKHECPPGYRCVGVGHKDGTPPAFYCTPTAPPPTEPPAPPPTTLPPTPAPLCVIDFDVVDLAQGGAASAELDDAVKTAEIHAHPEGCEAGRCVLNMSRPQWHHEVCAELEVAGYCCGYTDADEITVGTSNQPGTRVTNFHPFTGPGDGPGTVLWPPQARRDAWTLVPKGAIPTPTPTPPPGPPSACPPPVPPGEGNFVWGDLKPTKWRDANGDLVWGYDATLNVERACGYCASIGMGDMGGTIRCRCPVRNENQLAERFCWEKAIGAVWTSDGQVIVNPENHSQAGCLGCTWLRVSTKDGSAFREVRP